MKKILGTIFLILLFSILGYHVLKSRQSEVVRVSDYLPESSDPLYHNSLTNALPFSSIYAPIVSDYHVGEYAGILADRWTASEDYKTWKFHVRAGMRFENGDSITGEVIRKSLLRLAFVMKERGSRSDLFEHLIGHHGHWDISSGFPGLSLEGEWLTFAFLEPHPGLIIDLTSPIYAIVHPSSYDSRGRWLDLRRVIASGPYRVSLWDKDVFEMELRDDIPEGMTHPRPIERFRFVTAPEERKRAELVVASSKHQLEKQGYSFFGGAEIRTLYLRCASWPQHGSVCHDRDARINLRDSIYKALTQNGLVPLKSFFPLVVTGIHEVPTTPDRDGIGALKVAGHSAMRFSPCGEALPARMELTEALSSLKAAMALDITMKPMMPSEKAREYAPDLPQYSTDIICSSTDLLMDNVDSLLHFMFQSKESIRLPDPTGRISRELDATSINVQKINELLADDAIIWPITQFSLGIWTKPEIDLSLMNMATSIQGLHWAGWRN